MKNKIIIYNTDDDKNSVKLFAKDGIAQIDERYSGGCEGQYR